MSAVCTHLDRIEVTSLPDEIAGCEDCLAIGDSWVHLRMCMTRGKIGCCDSSPSQHASHHAVDHQHPIVRSFEPDEDWFYDYSTDDYAEGLELAPPDAHPRDQPVPGPAGRVPPDWEDRLN